MRDEKGFLIRCEYSDWKIIDARDNKDYVCLYFPTYNYSAHICYADEQCKYYKPIKKGINHDTDK
jgi:hypothetical protein